MLAAFFGGCVFFLFFWYLSSTSSPWIMCIRTFTEHIPSAVNLLTRSRDARAFMHGTPPRSLTAHTFTSVASMDGVQPSLSCYLRIICNRPACTGIYSSTCQTHSSTVGPPLISKRRRYKAVELEGKKKKKKQGAEVGVGGLGGVPRGSSASPPTVGEVKRWPGWGRHKKKTWKISGGGGGSCRDGA